MFGSSGIPRTDLERSLAGIGIQFDKRYQERFIPAQWRAIDSAMDTSRENRQAEAVSASANKMYSEAAQTLGAASANRGVGVGSGALALGLSGLGDQRSSAGFRSLEAGRQAGEGSRIASVGNLLQGGQSNLSGIISSMGQEGAGKAQEQLMRQQSAAAAQRAFASSLGQLAGSYDWGGWNSGGKGVRTVYEPGSLPITTIGSYNTNPGHVNGVWPAVPGGS